MYVFTEENIINTTVNFEYFNLNDNEMKELMLSSDIAIASGGQVLIEMARTGIPAIYIKRQQKIKMKYPENYKKRSHDLGSTFHDT